MKRILSLVGGVLPSKGVMILTLATLLLVSTLSYKLSVAYVKEGMQSQSIQQLKTIISELSIEIVRINTEHGEEVEAVIEIDRGVSEVVCVGKNLVADVADIKTTKEKDNLKRGTTENDKQKVGVADIDDRLPASVLSILDRM